MTTQYDTNAAGSFLCSEFFLGTSILWERHSTLLLLCRTQGKIRAMCCSLQYVMSGRSQPVSRVWNTAGASLCHHENKLMPIVRSGWPNCTSTLSCGWVGLMPCAARRKLPLSRKVECKVCCGCGMQVCGCASAPQTASRAACAVRPAVLQPKGPGAEHGRCYKSQDSAVMSAGCSTFGPLSILTSLCWASHESRYGGRAAVHQRCGIMYACLIASMIAEQVGRRMPLSA